MFFLFKPDRPRIDEFLVCASQEEFTYDLVGATKDQAPKGWLVDHNRVLIGQGLSSWNEAKKAVRTWKMFELDWVELCWPETAIETGSTVAVLVNQLGFYSLNAARIVYKIDEPTRFGFAYGTLESHAESGEERFTIECDPETDEIWYDLYAFSRPNYLLTRLGHPYARYLQKRFAADSLAAMKRAIGGR